MVQQRNLKIIGKVIKSEIIKTILRLKINFLS